jgi:hypothetical protein
MSDHNRWLRLDSPWNFRLLMAASVGSLLALLVGLAWWLSPGARASLWPALVIPGSLAAVALGLLLLLVTIQDWAAGEAWYSFSRCIDRHRIRVEQRACRWGERPAFFLMVLAAKLFCGIGATALGVAFLAGVLRSGGPG